MTVRLTEKEKKFLEIVVLNGSVFNGDEIDFTKRWKEQNIEDSDCWQTIYDYYDYPAMNKEFTMRSAVGIIASLNKKNLIHSYIEKRGYGDPDLNWLFVDEDNFNNLKAAYKN